MILPALNEHIADLKRLWKLCFMDEDRYIDQYFSIRFQEGQMLLWLEDKKVVGMVSMLPLNVWLDDKARIKNANYIYAVATDPSYQGRGISSALLRGALQEMKRKKEIAILIPATKKLVNFYQKRGFYSRKLQEEKLLYDASMQHPNQLKIAQLQAKSLDLNECEAIVYKRLRDLYFGKSGYFEWDKKAISYAINENAWNGGITYKVNWNGDLHILMGYANKEQFIIKETSVPVNERYDFSEQFCRKIKIRSVKQMEKIVMTNPKVKIEPIYFNLGLD